MITNAYTVFRYKLQSPDAVKNKEFRLQCVLECDSSGRKINHNLICRDTYVSSLLGWGSTRLYIVPAIAVVEHHPS